MRATRREVVAGFLAAAGATIAASNVATPSPGDWQRRHQVKLVFGKSAIDSEVWVDGELLKYVTAVVVCQVRDATCVRLEQYMPKDKWLSRSTSSEIPREWIELAFADHDVTIEVRK